MTMLVNAGTLARLRCDDLENTSALRHRQIDGKIKEMPPRVGQATDVACLPAGASVGARAARRQRANNYKAVSGTMCAIDVLGTVAETRREDRYEPA